jgi:hypothetical protein
LADKEIQSLGLHSRQWTDSLVLQNATSDFGLRYDRRWRVIANEGAGVVLRFIDDNLLLGQCTLKSLNSLPSVDSYTLERFRQDVAQTTAEKGQIADDEEFTSNRGLRVMRIDVKGKVDDVEVTWRYYHLAQADGRRLSYVVTFDSEVASRFDGIDRTLIESLEFLGGSGRGVKAQNASVSREGE